MTPEELLIEIFGGGKLHQHPSSLAGQTVMVDLGDAAMGRGGFPASKGPFEYLVEDWWDRITGSSWMVTPGSPAVMGYNARTGDSDIPMDNEVLYGKIGPFGYLVHISEIVTEENHAE